MIQPPAEAPCVPSLRTAALYCGDVQVREVPPGRVQTRGVRLRRTRGSVQAQDPRPWVIPDRAGPVLRSSSFHPSLVFSSLCLWICLRRFSQICQHHFSVERKVCASRSHVHLSLSALTQNKLDACLCILWNEFCVETETRGPLAVRSLLCLAEREMTTEM